jgi:site-specific DNA recombinase
MESAWSNGRAAYRCRHGHTSAAAPDLGRPKNAYLREDRALERLPALHLILTQAELPRVRRRRTRRGVDVRAALGPQDAARFFRENETVLVYDHVTETLRIDKTGTTASVVRKAS